MAYSFPRLLCVTLQRGYIPGKYVNDTGSQPGGGEKINFNSIHVHYTCALIAILAERLTCDKSALVGVFCIRESV